MKKVILALSICLLTCFTALQAQNKIKRHKYVDLGLPSGLKWATCNVGANSPEEYGNCYAWGEIETKKSYTIENSETYKKNHGNISGNPKYDAAQANWGGTWRMPTKEEFEELLNNCTWEWTAQEGKNGYKVTGANGNSIFLPAAGSYHDTGRISDGKYGGYWSATPHESNPQYTHYLNFYEGLHNTLWDNRYRGRSIRPVSY